MQHQIVRGCERLRQAWMYLDNRAHQPRHSVAEAMRHRRTNRLDEYGAQRESIFYPLLVCIESCLFFEVVTLWRDEYLIALGFRLMIGVFVCVACHFRNRALAASGDNVDATSQTDNEIIVDETAVIETHDLVYLLPIVVYQDVVVALLTRGLFNFYSLILIYTPCGLYWLYTHQKNTYVVALRDSLIRLYRRHTSHLATDGSSSINTTMDTTATNQQDIV